MRALLIAVTATLTLAVLAGCGNEVVPAAQDQTSASAQPTKPAPEPPSVIAEPTKPAPEPTPGGKPQNPAGGEPPVSIGPNGPNVPPGVTEVPAAQIDATALPDYFEYGDKVWQFNGGFSLQLFAAASTGCSDAEALLADQSADSVKIMVRPMDGPQGGRPDDGMCTMVMTPRPVVITLDTPLQDRKIYLSAGR